MFSPPALRRTLRLAPVALLLACGGDGATPTGTKPPPISPPARDTDLDSLFGTSADAVRATIAAQRAALATAAEAALGGDIPAAVAGPAAARLTPVRPAPARLAPARLAAAAGPTSPTFEITSPADVFPPYHYGDSQTDHVTNVPDPYSVTTTATLDATVTGGTLSIVGSETSTVRRLPKDGAPGPLSTVVSEVRKQLDIDVCPDGAGLSAGRWTSSERTWSVRNSTDVAGPANHDMLVEQTAEGTTTAHVNDAAELQTFDVDVRVAARKMRGPGNRPIDKRGTWHVVRSGVVPGRLVDKLGDAMMPERTGDYDLLNTIGHGPQTFYTLFAQRVRTGYGRARRIWRGGGCVHVVPARGATGGPLRPNETVELGPEARHLLDGSVVAVGTHDAVASSGSVAAPASGVVHPATFRFTMPATGGARVAFTHTSRRGIGTGSVAFAEAGAANGRIDYQATSTYSVSGTDEWDQTVSGSLTGQETVETTFQLEFDRREADGTRWYKVLAENRIALGGQGELKGAIDGYKVTFKANLDGQGTSHNPLAAGDTPLKEHRIIAPYQRRPQYTAGEMRLYTRNGRPHYDLRVNINQIAPGFTWSQRVELECPGGGWGTATSAYDNGTRAEVVTVDDPKRCVRNPGSGFTSDAPYTFGAISTNWFDTDPVTGSNAMVTGTYEPGAAQLDGSATQTFTSCERVTYLDPTQLGQFALSHSGFPIGLSFIKQGTCQLTYTIRWAIPLPAGG